MYNKLVRDNIPDIIKNNGSKPIIKILDKDEFKKALEIKLEEEKEEVLNASGLDRIEELADLYEVMSYLAELEGYSIFDVKEKAKEKRKIRGGFRKKIFLVAVEDEK